jgi:hypothetical protein
MNNYNNTRKMTTMRKSERDAIKAKTMRKEHATM